MRFSKLLQIASLAPAFLIAAAPALANPRLHRGPTSPRLFKPRAIPAPPKPKSAAGIAPERATQIQAALIKAGYLTGEPTGTWDTSTAAAMQKLQGDNGWQTKLVPDARAIIKLGLGPNATPATETPESSEADTETPATTSVPANK